MKATLLCLKESIVSKCLQEDTFLNPCVLNGYKRGSYNFNLSGNITAQVQALVRIFSMIPLMVTIVMIQPGMKQSDTPGVILVIHKYLLPLHSISEQQNYPLLKCHVEIRNHILLSLLCQLSLPDMKTGGEKQEKTTHTYTHKNYQIIIQWEKKTKNNNIEIATKTELCMYRCNQGIIF